MASFADLKAKRQSKNGVVAASALADSSATAKTMTADEDMSGTQAEATTSGNGKQTYSISLYGLDDGLLEIRDTPDAGRGLFAKKKITPGTVLMSRKPYLALLDKAHLPVICSNCMRDRGRELLRCAGCAAVWYCSKVSGDILLFAPSSEWSDCKSSADSLDLKQCQKEQWQPLKHKLECRRLRQWADEAKKAGVTDDRSIPDTPVRAIGNMLLLKEHMPKEVSRLKLVS